MVICPNCGKEGDYYFDGLFIECRSCGYQEWQEKSKGDVNLYNKWSDKEETE